jgi:hypothetical protein
MRVIEAIIALNDRAGWTRTMIADWLEAFEDRHPEIAERLAPDSLHGYSDEDSEGDLAGVCVG